MVLCCQARHLLMAFGIGRKARELMDVNGGLHVIGRLAHGPIQLSQQHLVKTLSAMRRLRHTMKRSESRHSTDAGKDPAAQKSGEAA